jgi:2-oxoglutarate ferredoxin oxidoreductase subunit alpha
MTTAIAPRTDSPSAATEPQMVMGNIASAEGALAVGCRFFAGYPITPSSEIMAHMATRLPELGGAFIQMEDEIASLSAVVGAAWAGAKPMTATSGPGFSLMMEFYGYGVMTETPLVIVDVQRAGPCTGQATHIGQGDVMQIRYGSHGDILPIALAPWSVQEMYDHTIRAFNLAERYRVPVVVAADEGVGHLREGAIFHRAFEVASRDRGQPGCLPFGTPEPDGIPPMPCFGDGANLLVTGSTHDAAGFRKNDHPKDHDVLVRRLTAKIASHRDDIVEVERIALDDAEIAILAYGFTARSGWAAVRRLRAAGRKVGMLRLKTLWPFPEAEIAALGKQVRRMVFPELNLGQLVTVARASTPTEIVAINQVNGHAMAPATIVRRVEEIW